LKSWCPDLIEDEAWNLYKINKNTPLICAHMDTVGSAAAQTVLDRVAVIKSGMETPQSVANWIVDKNQLYWNIIIWANNIWADDKCWIAIAMQLYEELWDKISLLFTVQEETWWGWVEYFCKHSSELLKDITYCIIPDRTNAWDIICNSNNYWTEEFEDKLVEFSWEYWFKPAMWVRCDADTLNEYMNCVNMSTGYYWHHTSAEYVVVDEFKNAYEAIKNIVINFNEKLEKPDLSYSYNRLDYGWLYEDRYATQYFDEDVYMPDNETLRVSNDMIIYSPNWKLIELPKWDYAIELKPKDESNLYM
jgi:hypothetical protein